jgi:sterol desaturase/sphingolipid hydroxylase (fatty acid hydroxylase superfamily)
MYLETEIRANSRDRWLLLASVIVSATIAIAAWQATQVEGNLLQKLGRLALYVAPLPAVLMLTRLFPAVRSQGLITPGTLQDAGYFLLIIAFRIAFTAFFITAVTSGFERHLGHLAFHVGEQWPVWLRVLVALLFGDFLAWFHHLVRHKIGAFWEFHKVHHSQRDMNYFTDFRMHPIDYVIANLIVIVPQLMLQVDVPTIVLIGILVQWHTMTYHSNLRWNYGPLRFVLVTPQSHRVHHSCQPEHHDRNFGVIFSIWDHLFGTQYRYYDCYPDTGVEARFPNERSFRDVLLLRPLWQQMIHPFRQVLRRRA